MLYSVVFKLQLALNLQGDSQEAQVSSKGGDSPLGEALWGQVLRGASLEPLCTYPSLAFPLGDPRLGTGPFLNT